MKRKLITLALLAYPAWCQWTVWDPGNYGVNIQNLQQGIRTYQEAVAYKQMFQNASAFLRNPAAFMSAAMGVSNATAVLLQQNGSLSAARIQQMQRVMAMGQVAMQEAQLAQALSSGNASGVGQLSVQMAQVGLQLAEAQRQEAFDMRVSYYTQKNAYQPQAQAISGWRLK